MGCGGILIELAVSDRLVAAASSSSSSTGWQQHCAEGLPYSCCSPNTAACAGSTMLHLYKHSTCSGSPVLPRTADSLTAGQQATTPHSRRHAQLAGCAWCRMQHAAHGTRHRSRTASLHHARPAHQASSSDQVPVIHGGHDMPSICQMTWVECQAHLTTHDMNTQLLSCLGCHSPRHDCTTPVQVHLMHTCVAHLV